ncbi:hypothetical protein PHBOTO_000062 [Pseudozyma hubeiensis]|nr:hypothetical protein PHBOTO_000062 [Pseudozyma hubeiensis]
MRGYFCWSKAPEAEMYGSELGRKHPNQNQPGLAADSSSPFRQPATRAGDNDNKDKGKAQASQVWVSQLFRKS